MSWKDAASGTEGITLSSAKLFTSFNDFEQVHKEIRKKSKHFHDLLRI